jgi:hypothetical protein
MDDFTAYMRKMPYANESIRFTAMAKRLVCLVEALPLGEAWAHVLLRGLHVQVDWQNPEKLDRRLLSLLWYADHEDWAGFCVDMWISTVPNMRRHAGPNDDMERSRLFHAIEECRGMAGMDADSLGQLSAVETLCWDFNNQLGWCCAEHAKHALAYAREDATRALAKVQAGAPASNEVHATHALAHAREDGSLRSLLVDLTI